MIILMIILTTSLIHLSLDGRENVLFELGSVMVNMAFHQVDVEHPEFRTTFRSTEQCVEVEFTSLTAALHQEALLELMELSAKFLPPRCVKQAHRKYVLFCGAVTSILSQRSLHKMTEAVLIARLPVRGTSLF